MEFEAGGLRRVEAATIKAHTAGSSEDPTQSSAGENSVLQLELQAYSLTHAFDPAPFLTLVHSLAAAGSQVSSHSLRRITSPLLLMLVACQPGNRAAFGIKRANTPHTQFCDTLNRI